MPGAGRSRSRAKKQLADEGSITDVPRVTAGHAHNATALTGCTVVIFGGEGAVAAVDVRGGAPGTRETDLLRPDNLVERINAVLLTGGSVFGLDAACGVTRYLEEHRIGFETVAGPVPIVPAAVIYDLAVGDPSVRPDSRMGYEACANASGKRVSEGRAGAGAGATVGKILGHEHASRGGVGTASLRLRSGATVGALVVVNSFGDIVDPATGQILAGARSPGRRGWINTARTLVELTVPPAPRVIENTTLAIVATDAALTKSQALRVAAMAHDGMARAINPVHTPYDGDTVFVASTGERLADVSVIGAAAGDVVTRAIVRVGRGSRV
jgi:L-aminopeptidase/D-esterase-like protein